MPVRLKKRKQNGEWYGLKTQRGRDEMGNMYVSVGVCVCTFINTHIHFYVLKIELRRLCAGLDVCVRKIKLNIG